MNTPVMEFESFLNPDKKLRVIKDKKPYWYLRLLEDEKPYGMRSLMGAMSENIFLVGDLHIGDPLNNWREKRDKIITTINSVVKPSDHLLILGDLSSHTNVNILDDVKDTIDKFNCRNLYLILGNNDQGSIQNYIDMGFKTVTDRFIWKNYVFTHMPEPASGNTINVHAHIHEEITYINIDWHNHINIWDRQYVPIRLRDAIKQYESGYYKGCTITPEEIKDREDYKYFEFNHDKINTNIEPIDHSLKGIITQESYSFQDEVNLAWKYSQLEESLGRSKLPDSEFGVPQQRKFPLDTKLHVISAIKMFNHVDPMYEEELAKNIKKKMKEFGVENVSIGPKNRFINYCKQVDAKDEKDIAEDALDATMTIVGFAHPEAKLVYNGGKLVYAVAKKITGNTESLSVVTEAKTYKLLTEDEIKAKAREFLKSSDENIRSLGTVILDLFETTFDVFDKFLGVVSLVLIMGVATIDILVVILSVISILIVTLPFDIIKKSLKSQIKFLRGRLKPDSVVKNYYSAVNNILKADMVETIQLESLIPILEAPKMDEDEDDDLSPEDFTEDAENDNLNEESEEEPEDFTSDVEPEDESIEDSDDTEISNEDTDEPEDFTEDVQNDTDTSEDLGDDEEDDDLTPEDFTEDSDSEDESLDDTSTEDMEETESDNISENDEDNNNLQNSIIKNYNLILDFQKLHKSIEDILQHLKTVVYSTTLQQSILARCMDNMVRVENELNKYVEYSFSRDYKVNLYYYNIYIQALKINLEMLRRISNLDKDSKQ